METASRNLILGLEKLHQALSRGPNSERVLAVLLPGRQQSLCVEGGWRRVGSQEVRDCPVIAVEVEGLVSELHIQITRNPGEPGSECITFLDLHSGTVDDEYWSVRMSEALGSAFGPSEMLGKTECYRKTTDHVQKTLLKPEREAPHLLMVRRSAVRNR